MSPVSVKICGVRDLETALAAARAGADYLGFVFFRKSRGFCPQRPPTTSSLN